MSRTISVSRRALAAGALALAAVLAAPAQAQGGFTSLYPGQPRVSVGARAGLSLATLSGDAVQEAGYRPGFAGGLVATVNVNPLLAIQPELLYVQKGASIDADGGVTPFGTGEQEIRISTVEVPVLLRVNVPVRSAAVPYLYAGPSFGFTVSASREFDATPGIDDDLIEDEDFEDSVRGTTIGMAVGGGFDLRLPTAGRVTLDGRYTFGLTDAFEDGAGTSVGDAPDARNGAFQVTLGFGL